jgi:pSer/pThr/pTyr-binding forkhead associated (FHA) protein
MSSPARSLTGRPATDDLDSSIATDTETTMVPVIVADTDSAPSRRLRLRFDDRDLVVDERSASIRIGRAEENEVVVNGHLSSRLHARIVIGRSNFVLIDQSTNGTFVQTRDGEDLFVHHDILQLKGQGMIGLGCLPEQGSQHTIHFTCEEICAG